MEILTFLVQKKNGIWLAIDIIDSLQGVIVIAIFVLHRPVKDKLFSRRQLRCWQREKNESAQELSSLNTKSELGENHSELITPLKSESIENLRASYEGGDQ